MGNTLVGHVCTTPGEEEVAAAAAAAQSAGVASQNEDKPLSQHQSALTRARQAGDSSAAGYEVAVQFWTKRARCSRMLLDVLCAKVVLLLDCIVEDPDGVYTCPATKQLLLDRHAGLRTAEATRLAEWARTCACRMYREDPGGYDWCADTPLEGALQQAYVAARRARLWGDAAAVEATSRAVRHLLALWWAYTEVHLSRTQLHNVISTRLCSCSLCSRRTTGSSSAGESETPAPPELLSRAGSDVSSGSGSGDAGGDADAHGGAGGGEDASVLLLPPSMALSGVRGTHPRRGFLPQK